MLSVLVTLDGVPLSNLGASIPLNPAGITLPPGWSLVRGSGLSVLTIPDTPSVP